MEHKETLDFLAGMKKSAEDEIGELNLYLNRDDIPTWKVAELKDRVRALETRINIIDELVFKLSS